MQPSPPLPIPTVPPVDEPFVALTRERCPVLLRHSCCVHSRVLWHSLELALDEFIRCIECPVLLWQMRSLLLPVRLPMLALTQLSNYLTLKGSFSAVSKPNFASKYALESSRRDLQNALLCTVLESNPKKPGNPWGEKNLVQPREKWPGEAHKQPQLATQDYLRAIDEE